MEAGKLAHVVAEMDALKQGYNGTYSIRLYTNGGGAFVFERLLPLPQLGTAVDFEADSDIDDCFEQFRKKVKALF